jgi:bifunctional DNA-binding transcriptional regulator/antitoxin component of YhaV-PrlF toxin-antitoxin module
MFLQTLKISSKGQFVLPKKVRSILGNNIISIKVDDNNQVTLSGVTNLAGSLSSYKKETDLSFDEIRDRSWKDNLSTHKKHDGTPE